MKEQIKGFNEAYEIAKKLGFKNYFILPETTWEDAHDNFERGARILNRTSMIDLQRNVNMVLKCSGCIEKISDLNIISRTPTKEFLDLEEEDKNFMGQAGG